MSVRKKKPEPEVVERVPIVDILSGTICTVGSNVVGKYLRRKKAYRAYDPERDGAIEEYDDGTDGPDDGAPVEPTPGPTAKPARKV